MKMSSNQKIVRHRKKGQDHYNGRRPQLRNNIMSLGVRGGTKAYKRLTHKIERHQPVELE